MQQTHFIQLIKYKQESFQELLIQNFVYLGVFSSGFIGRGTGEQSFLPA